MAYTPGPWFLNGDCVEADGTDGPRDVTVATVNLSFPGNARVIVSAPDLAACLEDCANWLGRLSNCKASDRCVDAARSLLEHVRGGE